MSSNLSATPVLITVRSLSAGAASGRLTCGGLDVACALGRGGITRDKREGDGAAPAGRFALLTVYYRADRVARPRTRLPVTELHPWMGWCDAPDHPRYNHLVTRPFTASHEAMWRDDHLYDIVVVLDCNLRPAVRGRGSAIFFHLARPGYPPTEGCVAVKEQDMRHILERCGPGAAICID
ncbi:L,D-transpeptidase [Stappia sp. ES.058]|uniref:L,D-transpeptidase family protein n=1 Tax=Stappia sp. ES.058 TaxID=1881061 RepID=UPI00087C1DA7|nr:L,D-transpeptidase family protein [Stappia sp. ES.058]SDU39610.1 L,D-peptidoglycan transpeptidase YkuD, ErfK/YbiS/YcfS/YnhG family [Stappia sp. ES.058]